MLPSCFYGILTQCILCTYKFQHTVAVPEDAGSLRDLVLMKRQPSIDAVVPETTLPRAIDPQKLAEARVVEVRAEIRK